MLYIRMAARMIRKILLTVHVITSSLQFSLPLNWNNVCLSSPLSWVRKDDRQKMLNLVSMEDAVKLSIRMRWLSPLPWCLCIVSTVMQKMSIINWHDRNHSSASCAEPRLGLNVCIRIYCFSSRQEINQKEQFPRILQGKYKLENRLWEKWWLFHEVGIWSRTRFILIYDTYFCVCNNFCTKKVITFWLILVYNIDGFIMYNHEIISYTILLSTHVNATLFLLVLFLLEYDVYIQ